tara:strand:- start:6235 stop:6459 length:225 start_codon:yes stop_codon:yes gene_type:complete
MGYGSKAPPKPKGMSKPKVSDAKPVKKKTTSMSDKLKEHSKHHSKKHMDMMRKDIKDGMSFTKAHNRAKKMVGK